MKKVLIVKGKKRCSSCKKRKDVSEFYRRSDRPDGSYFSRCKKCYTKSSRESTIEIKRKTISLYGGKCACCGENRIEFLSIDHINGGGREDRKNSAGRGNRFYKTILPPNKIRKDLRVLCMNCNCSIGHYGYCPHNTKKEK